MTIYLPIVEGATQKVKWNEKDRDGKIWDIGTRQKHLSIKAAEAFYKTFITQINLTLPPLLEDY